MNTSNRKRGKVMRKNLLLLAIATVLACVTAATGLAAGSTQVTHFSFTTPRHQLCGIWGTAVVHGTSVFRDTGNGTYFMSGTFFGVFTAADSGKSTTLVGAGPVKQTAPPVIDEQAGTVTIATTYDGLYEKFSITGGPTLSINAGAATFVDVFEYTGDPNNPVGDLISETLSRLDGPHPDLASGGCEVLVPYLQGP
jgi:hypothetical protein